MGVWLAASSTTRPRVAAGLSHRPFVCLPPVPLVPRAAAVFPHRGLPLVHLCLGVALDSFPSGSFGSFSSSEGSKPLSAGAGSSPEAPDGLSPPDGVLKRGSSDSSPWCSSGGSPMSPGAIRESLGPLLSALLGPCLHPLQWLPVQGKASNRASYQAIGRWGSAQTQSRNVI